MSISGGRKHPDCYYEGGRFLQDKYDARCREIQAEDEARKRITTDRNADHTAKLAETEKQAYDEGYADATAEHKAVVDAARKVITGFRPNVAMMDLEAALDELDKKGGKR